MAMTIQTEGLEQLNAMMAELKDGAMDVAAKALYAGAGVVGDAFTAAEGRIATAPFRYAPPGQTRLPSPEEKAAVTGKSGIAKFHNTGDGVDTLIGISGAAGYANIAGKPKAVRLIARSINSGTSFMQKQPVFRKAVSQSSGAAKAATVAKAEEMFNEIIKA